MKKVMINNIEYQLEKDYRDGFDIIEVSNRLTDYFDEFDYIFGDWSYGKLRLKGYFNKNNPKCKDINNINNLDEYIKKNCSYECKYFLLKK